MKMRLYSHVSALACMDGLECGDPRRQLRLVVDWTVDLLFGRDTSELGQLGHPPVLEMKRRAAEGGRFEPAERTEASGAGPH